MNLNRATLLSDALKKDETGPCQAQPAKTIRRKKSLKKSLTLRSDALQKDDERPAQPPDCALQAAAEPGQKYGSMAASPYRQMKKGQRRPHGVGPKDPKHGFFGALPLRQRGRRIYACIMCCMYVLTGLCIYLNKFIIHILCAYTPITCKERPWCHKVDGPNSTSPLRFGVSWHREV